MCVCVCVHSGRGTEWTANKNTSGGGDVSGNPAGKTSRRGFNFYSVLFL